MRIFGSGKKRQWLFVPLRVVILAYAVVCLGAYLFQDRLVYVPETGLSATPAALNLSYEDVTLTTEDQCSLSAWFVPAKPARATILFCHGNAGNLSGQLETIRIFHELGCSVLAFDYRGYGNSSGTPSEIGTYLDAMVAWRYLTETRNIQSSKILIVGRSLGGAVAAHLASEVQAGALVLESTFTSLPDVGAKAYPFLPVRWFSKYAYNTRALLPGLRMPLLIFHSREDEIIPFAHAEELFRCAKEPKKLVELTGDHNGGFMQSKAAYEAAFSDMLMNF